MKRVYINDDDVVYVPFRVARVKSAYSCLVPKKGLAFVVKNNKRINVNFSPDHLYIADAKTPQILIDLAMKNEESMYRAASLALGHQCDKTIDHTYKIIQHEYSKIQRKQEFEFIDDIYEEDIKKLNSSESPKRDLMCDFISTLYDEIK